jgi:hypothetical protein
MMTFKRNLLVGNGHVLDDFTLPLDCLDLLGTSGCAGVHLSGDDVWLATVFVVDDWVLGRCVLIRGVCCYVWAAFSDVPFFGL